MKYDDRLWDEREHRVAGPGSNRSRAKARKQAKTRGNKRVRRIDWTSGGRISTERIV